MAFDWRTNPDPLPEVPTRRFGVLTKHRHRTAVTDPMTLENLDGGRLTGSIGSEQSEHLARFDRKIHAINGAHVPVMLDEPLNRYHAANLEAPVHPPDHDCMGE